MASGLPAIRCWLFSIGQLLAFQPVGRRRMDRERRGCRERLVRLRFPIRFIHKPLEPMLLGLNFSHPPSNFGTPLLRSPHFLHKPLFFHFKHGQFEEGAGGSSGAATIHQPGHRFNMLHTTRLSCHGFPLFLSLSQDSERGGRPTPFFSLPQPERARVWAGSTAL